MHQPAPGQSAPGQYAPGQHAPPPTKRSGSTGLIVGLIVAGVFLVMVVLGCVGIGLLLPALGNARQAARQVQGASMLRTLGLSVHIYAQDNRDMLPSPATWQQDLIATGLATPDAFVSPYGDTDNDGVSYIYLARERQRVTGVPFVPILAEDPGDSPTGTVNVYFDDGSIRTMTEEELDQAIRDAAKLTRPVGP